VQNLGNLFKIYASFESPAIRQTLFFGSTLRIMYGTIEKISLKSDLLIQNKPDLSLCLVVMRTGVKNGSKTKIKTFSQLSNSQCGLGRDRTGDLTIFSRSLLPNQQGSR
jgi:hypothetical protein